MISYCRYRDSTLPHDNRFIVIIAQHYFFKPRCDQKLRFDLEWPNLSLCVLTLFPQGGGYFPVEQLLSLIVTGPVKTGHICTKYT